MPFGIFLFALKFEFQKSEKDGVKVGVTLRVLSPKSRRSRVYHQHEVLYIIKVERFAYHQAAGKMHADA